MSAKFKIMLAVFIVSQWMLGNLFAQNKLPVWVEQRPVNPNYYIGIGYASKSEHPTDFQKVARDNALSDIASQIKVQINSDFVQQVVEKAGMVADDFKSYVRSSTKAELEGYEQVDSYETPTDYWVYYRLSKAKYKALKAAKLNKAKALSLDMFKKARAAEQAGKIAKALLFYFQAIPPIEKYVNESLEAEVDGQHIYLFNEIYSSLQRILSGLKLDALTPEVKGKLGQPIANPLKVKVGFVSGATARPVQNMPVLFAFTRGNGDLIKRAYSDANGVASTRVLRISSADNLQIVQAKIDLNKMVNEENPSIVLKGIMSSLVAPTARFLIHVAGLTAYVETQESNMGHPVEIKQLEPALKRVLSDRGFTFSPSPAKADYLIKVKATARKGAEMYGLHSSFVTLTLSVIDLKSGQEIYKNSLDDVKGIDLTYEKAGVKALSNAAKEIGNKLIPDFLQKIQSTQ